MQPAAQASRHVCISDHVVHHVCCLDGVYDHVLRRLDDAASVCYHAFVSHSCAPVYHVPQVVVGNVFWDKPSLDEAWSSLLLAGPITALSLPVLSLDTSDPTKYDSACPGSGSAPTYRIILKNYATETGALEEVASSELADAGTYAVLPDVPAGPYLAFYVRQLRAEQHRKGDCPLYGCDVRTTGTSGSKTGGSGAGAVTRHQRTPHHIMCEVAAHIFIDLV